MDAEKNNIEIIRSKRKTLSIEISIKGIVVRAPLRASGKAIEEFIYEKRDWIKSKIDKINKEKEFFENVKPFTESEIRELVKKARGIIPPKVEYYASLIGVDYGKITIRSQRTRWGSCSGLGNLNFNCLLMLCPENVLDSVIVHELCHRKYMNHSHKFYKEIEKVFPEYKECHKWLKNNTGMLMSRLNTR